MIDRVETHVVDDARAQQVVSLIEEAEDALAAYALQVEGVGDRIAILNAEYHTSEDAYKMITAQALRNYEDLSDRLLDLRFEMKLHMSREEWTAVFSTQQ